MRPAAAISLDEIAEADWQKQVIELAHLFGWRVAHFRPAKTAKGWRTAVAADGAGWPDLFLTRDRAIALELKREKGKLTAEQREWLTGLHEAGVEAYVVRPGQLQDVADVLRSRIRISTPLETATGEELAA